MTITEALLKSRETGESFSSSCGGWVKWDPNWTYKLSGAALIADDWVPSTEFVEKLTEGRWTLAKED